MLIKIVNESNHVEVKNLVKKVFLEYEARDYSPLGVKTFMDSALNNSEYMNSLKIYGAYLDSNELVGVIATRMGGTHIALFFVDGRFHQQGIGRALFNKVKEACPKREITVNSSPYAVKVYEHLGFKKISEEEEENGILFTRMINKF